MHGKTIARIGAVAFVGVAITVAVIEARQPPARPAVPVPVVAATPDDPLGVALLRCQSIGQAGASDPYCLRTWSENRRRFLGLPRPLPIDPAPGGASQQTPPTPRPVVGGAPLDPFVGGN